MRIVLDIPDWAEERHIYVMAGIEMLAYKLYGESVVHIKSTRCNMCGKCCMNVPEGHLEAVSPEGHCSWLDPPSGDPPIRECGLHINRPWICNTSLENKDIFPGCCIEYREEPVG